MTGASGTDNGREETTTSVPGIAQPDAPGLDFAVEVEGLIGDLLGNFTSHEGLSVDYAALGASDGFHAYSEESNRMSMFDPGMFEDQDEKMAFWINIYNMSVISRVIELEIKESVWENKGFFSADACRIGGFGYSLNDIENGILRGNARRPFFPARQFRKWDQRNRQKLKAINPGVCFTLAKGSKSCPPLHFYRGERIEAQLHAAARDFVNSGGAVLDRDNKILSISRLFKFRSADFGGDQGVLKLIANLFNSPEDAALLRSHASSLKVAYQDNDRRLNAPGV